MTLGHGSTVNRGCVVQTHPFHDRIMRMDTVVIEEGATLGTHCVALPASRIGAGATVGPVSLVMRGDEVPRTPVGRAIHCALGCFAQEVPRLKAKSPRGP